MSRRALWISVTLHKLFSACTAPFCFQVLDYIACIQGALKGTNLSGQTERPNADFRQISADSRLFLENKAVGKRRFSQKTADFCRKPQNSAGTRRKPQIGVCPGSSP